VPHGQHVSHAFNDTDVSVTSSSDHNVDESDKGDMEEMMNHAGTSKEIVWKGMMALAGIYLFFITERLISLCRTPRRRSDKVLLIYNIFYSLS